MGVLSSLLPGLRTLRAPLAAGYIWLLNIWLLFGDQLPSRDEAAGLVERLYDLEGVVSEVGMVLALSFVAFLVGAISETGSRYILMMFPGSHIVRASYAQFLDRETRRLGIRHRLAKEELERVQAAARDMNEGRVLVRQGIRGYRPVDDEFGVTALREMGRIRARLMAEQTALYGEHDRIQSEAEFRVTIVPPLVFFVVTVALSVHPLWLLALAPLGLLLYQANGLRSQAGQVLVAAVTSGKVKSPYLENLEAEIQQVVEENKQAAERLAGTTKRVTPLNP